MASMDLYPKAAMERAMKVQDVMLQAMAKKITWWQAAEILVISDRHMRRWREGYEQEGYNGLCDRRLGKPSSRRVPLAVVEKVLALYREKYFDLNVQHFHEKLAAEHGMELSYTWVKQALQGAGLVARGRKRGVYRKRRARRPLPGLLLHIDGSRHQWFQDQRWYDRIVILDDATSEIYYAQLVEEESTLTGMAGLKEVIERKGVFCALYSDRGSHCSTGAFRWQRHTAEPPSCPVAAGIWSGSSRCSANARSTATTPSAFRTCACRLSRCAGAPPWPDARWSCISTWMER